MEIKDELTGEQGIFFVVVDDRKVAEMTFRLQGADRIIIEHTSVSGAMKGQGIGKKLVEHSIEFARKNKLKIIPLCSFAKSFFEKSTGYEDVL